MQVRCCCGQSFTVQNVQFPYRVGCFVCGRRLMVNEDGTFDEIRARSIHLVCRCGQAFVVNSVEFPRKLHCVTCKRHFSVFDTGEIIDTNEELPEIRPTPTAFEDRTANATRKIYGSMAIRTKLTRSEPSPPVDPVRRRRPKGPPIEKKSVSGKSKTARDELASIDARWRVERCSYALFDCFGVVVFVSRRFAAILGAICFVHYAISWILVSLTGDVFRPLVSVGFGIVMGITVFLGMIILECARKYEDAEAEWLRQRSIVIEKHESLS